MEQRAHSLKRTKIEELQQKLRRLEEKPDGVLSTWWQRITALTEEKQTLEASLVEL